jgi:hypothetical protein
VLATLPYEALAPIGFATTGDTKTILLAVALLRLPRLLRCSRCLEHFRVAFGWLPPQLCLSKAQSRMLLVWSLWLYVVHAFTCFFLFAKYFPVIAVAEIKSILKTSGENYKMKMTDIEKTDAEKFYIEKVEHAH